MGLNLNESITKVETISGIGSRDVTIEGSRIELCKNKDLVDATVDTVAHGDIDQPIASSNWNLQIA